ncbi:MAG: anthranilate synthase component I family protein [Christensenellaceae bacterium]|jgi:anthranilate synthase component 1|nr:anthranilate synthase component I family protein [Christensenellaceae bacterium]
MLDKRYKPNLSLDEARSISDGFLTIPISIELSHIKKQPSEVFLILKAQSKRCFILESLEDKGARGRYTILSYDPILGIDCLNGDLVIRGVTDIKIDTKNPAAYIKKIISENKSPKINGAPPFAGGLVGYFAYDYIKYAEPTLSLDAPDEEKFKDFDLMMFDKVITYDHVTNKVILTISVKTKDLNENYVKAINELESMIRLVENGIPAKLPPLIIKSKFQRLFNKEQYVQMVIKAKKHIFEGDIFQVVLSNRMSASAVGSLFETYLELRQSNPSPYMFYFSSDDIEIAGASPETLVKVTENKAFTYPLAGTRKRGKDQEEDEFLEKELLSDEKELAEHNMLVDLGRNDIGKISKFGSVKVEKYLAIEKFSHVMHIGSAVSGEMLENLSAIDAIEAVLPAGTLSGAPKIRACEIINKLENNKRGIYGGAIGYISFSGDADTCIAIRIAFKKNNKVFIRSGAGIVADSVPEKEYEECENKAKAVFNALIKNQNIGDTNDFVD